MSRSIHALPRLTPDVTYRGELLGPLAYKAHLKILREIEAGKCMKSAGDFGEAPWETYTAFMAIRTHGLIKEPTARFRGYWELTDYGRVYLAQRR